MFPFSSAVVLRSIERYWDKCVWFNTIIIKYIYLQQNNGYSNRKLCTENVSKYIYLYTYVFKSAWRNVLRIMNWILKKFIINKYVDMYTKFIYLLNNNWIHNFEEDKVLGILSEINYKIMMDSLL